MSDIPGKAIDEFKRAFREASRSTARGVVGTMSDEFARELLEAARPYLGAKQRHSDEVWCKVYAGPPERPLGIPSESSAIGWVRVIYTEPSEDVEREVGWQVMRTLRRHRIEVDGEGA